MVEYGRAYAFFNAPLDISGLERELPSLREVSNTPDNLVLALRTVRSWRVLPDISEGLSRFVDGVNIYPILPSSLADQKQTASPIQMGDLDYVISGIAENRGNEQVAGELGDLLNGIYYLLHPQSSFTAAVIYEENGKYLFRE